jgi:hypothetical protein
LGIPGYCIILVNAITRCMTRWLLWLINDYLIANKWWKLFALPYIHICVPLFLQSYLAHVILEHQICAEILYFANLFARWQLIWIRKMLGKKLICWASALICSRFIWLYFWRLITYLDVTPDFRNKIDSTSHVYQDLLYPFQIIGHFAFSRFIYIIIYIDIHHI